MGEEEDEEEEEVVVGFVLGVFVDMSFLANLLGDGLDTSVFNSAGNLRGLLLGPSFGVEVTMEEEGGEEGEEGVVDFGGLSCGVVDDLEQVVVVVEQVVVMVEQVEVRAVVCGGAGTVGLMS